MKLWHVILIVVALGFMPIWRSGLRGHQTFYQFTLNHTIYGPPVEYIPEENYEEAMR